MKRTFLHLTLSVLALSVCGLAQTIPSHLMTNLLANIPGGDYSPEQLRTIKFADVTGDGLPDLCYLDNVGIQCAAFVKGSTPDRSMFGPPGLWSSEFTLANSQVDSLWQTIQYGDVDGDGVADLCGRKSTGFWCFRSDTHSFGPFVVAGGIVATAFADNTGFNRHPSYWTTIHLVDVNHDGKLDVCGRDPHGIECQRFDTDPTNRGFKPVELWSPLFSDDAGWLTDESLWSTIQFVDVQGNGLPAVCGRNHAGLICALNNGVAFGPTTITHAAFSDANGWNRPQYYKTIHFGDINGDGTADVCGRGPGGMICGLAAKTLVNRATLWNFVGLSSTAAPAFSDANGWDVQSHFQDIWLVDANHDGKADICARANGGIECAMAQTPSYLGTLGAPIAPPVFGPSRLLVANFGDNYNWNIYESNWGTVQPIMTGPPQPSKKASFCGRGDAGIWCSEFN